jgi:hypothetical protein
MILAPRASDMGGRMKHCYQIFTPALNDKEWSRKLAEFGVHTSVSSRTEHGNNWQRVSVGQCYFDLYIGQCCFKAESDKRSYRGSLNRGLTAGHLINEQLFSEVTFFLH